MTRTWTGLISLGLATLIGIGTYAQSAWAGSATGNVTVVAVGINTTVAFITISQDATGTRAACHAVADKRDYAFDPTTPFGKAFLAQAQAARLSGKPVDVSGGSTCLNVGSTPVEVLTFIKIHD